jgi:hypothetical protein
MFVYICIFIDVHNYIVLHIYTYICICLHIYLLLNIDIYIYIYIHIYIHRLATVVPPYNITSFIIDPTIPKETISKDHIFGLETKMSRSSVRFNR